MSDDWEDWEADDAEESLASKLEEAKIQNAAVSVQPTGDKPDISKFADEKDVASEVITYVIPETQPRKKVDEKKAYLKKDVEVDQALSEPSAERQRLKKLQEEADLMDSVFGGVGATNTAVTVLGSAMESLKDSDTIAAEVAKLFIHNRVGSKHYLAYVKNLAKYMCQNLDAGDIQDLERSLVILRSEKAKKEKEARDALKKPSKKDINQKSLLKGSRQTDYLLEAEEFEEDFSDEGDSFM